MARHASVSVRRSEWSPEVAAMLAPAVDPAVIDLDDLAQGVRDGHLIAYVASTDGAAVGALVARLDDFPSGRDFVTVAQRFTRVPGMVWTDFIVPVVIEAEGRRLGCNKVRMHVERPGMVRRLVGQGFAVSQMVMEKAL